ncbi:hypothetical protein ACEQPO_02545 [Bacillus sp. SL00103]
MWKRWTVEVTFAARTASTIESSNDTLAVFFVTQKDSLEEQVTMIQQIRRPSSVKWA